MTTSIIIQNLKCGGCKASIVRTLQAFPEVSSVEVDLDTAEVLIESADPQGRSRYEHALTQAGYPPVGEANTTLRKAKSYVSCAVGRMS